MGLISKLGVGLAALVLAAGGCAVADSKGASVQESQPRILGMDYDAGAGVAVIELRRMADRGSLDGPRDTHLVMVSLKDMPEGGVATPTAVAAEPGMMFVLPVLNPAGTAVYAARQRSEDWERLRFRAPSQLVRIDLASGRVTTIAEAEAGVLSVLEALEGENGEEQLVLSETLRFNDRGFPSGTRLSTLTVRDGVVVEGSRRVFDDLGSRGFELTLGGAGYIKGAVERTGGGEDVRTRVMALRADDLRAGRYELRDDLASAATYVTGCEPSTCRDLTARRAHAAVAAIEARPVHDTSRVRGVETTPENVTAAFEGRPSAFFPNEVDPFGTYRLDYDLAGGAVATPRGPQARPDRVPVVVMGGGGIPFRPVRTGFIDLAAYAAGRL